MRKLIALVLLLTCAVLPACASQPVTYEADAAELERQLINETRRGERMRSQVSALEEQVALLEDQLALLAKENEQVRAEAEQLQERLDYLDNEDRKIAHNRVWFFGMVERFPDDYIQERYNTLENLERLEQFARNYQNGVPDRIFISQDSNPAAELYIMWYDGGGEGYVVQPFWEVGRPFVLRDITFAQGAYYFTKEGIREENGTIYYRIDGQEEETDDMNYLFSIHDAVRIGVEGSGFVHP